MYNCSARAQIQSLNSPWSVHSEAEFKEVDPRLKFQTWLKHGWLSVEIIFSVSRFEPDHAQLDPVFGDSVKTVKKF